MKKSLSLVSDIWYSIRRGDRDEGRKESDRNGCGGRKPLTSGVFIKGVRSLSQGSGLTKVQLLPRVPKGRTSYFISQEQGKESRETQCPQTRILFKKFREGKNGLEGICQVRSWKKNNEGLGKKKQGTLKRQEQGFLLQKSRDTEGQITSSLPSGQKPHRPSLHDLSRESLCGMVPHYPTSQGRRESRVEHPLPVSHTSQDFR